MGNLLVTVLCLTPDLKKGIIYYNECWYFLQLQLQAYKGIGEKNMLQTTLCYLDIDDQTLLLHRIKKKNDVNHDKWIGIGGKFEHGESPEECIQREFREETGLTLLDWAYRGIVTFVSEDWCEYMHLFTATRVSGEIRECDEGTLEWVAWDKIAQLPIWEGDKVFLRLLKERETFFSLKLVYEGERLARAVLDGKEMAI